MANTLTRRELLGGAAAAWALAPGRPLVDTHIHLFAADRQRFPVHPNAPYKPAPAPLEAYAAFAASKFDHVVIVHPEPYQDDHGYLEYCFAHEPRAGFFKGTCLFDPIAPDTPARMEALVKKHPKRIVALRIHEMGKPGEPPTHDGAIAGRDMRHPAMQTTWRKVQALGLAIQMHFLPCHAPQIGELAAQFPKVNVILDHLARAGQGTPAEFEGVLKLARLPNVYMKYSGVNYSSKQAYPFKDAAPIVRKAFDAFGPGRMIWGGLGQNEADFARQSRLLEMMFDFASEADRDKIRGLNAMKLYGWT